MKSKIIIHLGLHRTGTTFLQKEVFERLTRVNYMFNDSLHTIQIKEGINLISNEGLSQSMPHSKFDRIQILDNIKKLFPNAKIILGIRYREDWLKSCYYRYVLSGGKLKYQKYIEHYSKNIIDNYTYLCEVRKRFSDVYTYTFEELKLMPKETIKDICKFIEVEVPEYQNIKRNASLSGRQLEMLRKINHTNLRHIVIPFIKWLQRTPT